jgi:hypothetical protein
VIAWKARKMTRDGAEVYKILEQISLLGLHNLSWHGFGLLYGVRAL